jgi:hypothetical protein
MPDYWLAANLDHGLGLEVRFLADPGAQTTSEDYGLQMNSNVERMDEISKRLASNFS